MVLLDVRPDGGYIGGVIEYLYSLYTTLRCQCYLRIIMRDRMAQSCEQAVSANWRELSKVLTEIGDTDLAHS